MTTLSTSSDICRDLIALAVKTDIPVLARRYRDLATAFTRLPEATGDIATNLRRSIVQFTAEIEQIQRDGFYANPLAHLRGVRNGLREAGQ